MNDPLGLESTRTPEIIRAERSAPLPMIRDLYTRITQPYAADSAESRLLMLAHLIYLTYADLKENQTK